MGLCLCLFCSEAKFLRLPTRHEEFFGGSECVVRAIHRAAFIPSGDLNEVFGHGVFADEDGDGLTECPIIEAVMVEVFFLGIRRRSEIRWVAVNHAVARDLHLREVHATDGQTLLLFVRKRGRETVETVETAERFKIFNRKITPPIAKCFAAM